MNPWSSCYRSPNSDNGGGGLGDAPSTGPGRDQTLIFSAEEIYGEKLQGAIVVTVHSRTGQGGLSLSEETWHEIKPHDSGLRYLDAFCRAAGVSLDLSDLELACGQKSLTETLFFERCTIDVLLYGVLEEIGSEIDIVKIATSSQSAARESFDMAAVSLEAPNFEAQMQMAEKSQEILAKESEYQSEDFFLEAEMIGDLTINIRGVAGSELAREAVLAEARYLLPLLSPVIMYSEFSSNVSLIGFVQDPAQDHCNPAASLLEQASIAAGLAYAYLLRGEPATDGFIKNAGSSVERNGFDSAWSQSPEQMPEVRCTISLRTTPFTPKELVENSYTVFDEAYPVLKAYLPEGSVISRLEMEPDPTMRKNRVSIGSWDPFYVALPKAASNLLIMLALLPHFESRGVDVNLIDK